MWIVMLVFGIIALSKGEFKITCKRKVKGSVGRVLGIILLFGAALSLIPFLGGFLQLIVLILVIGVGLYSSEKIVNIKETGKVD
jgi:hypothetical protein